jgi:hypothetical protein
MKISDITPANIMNFIQGNINFYINQNARHHLEQFLYRAYLCRDCLENGKCPHCGCTTPQMFFAPNKEDALGKWPTFFYNEEEWEAYKASNYQAMAMAESLKLEVDNDNYTNNNVSVIDIIKSADEIIRNHREKDTENPDIPVEETEFYKGLYDQETGLPIKHTEITSSDSLAGTVLLPTV